MNDKIKASIETLTEKISSGIKADDALKYTQAALNLAHVSQVLSQVKQTN